MKATPVPVPRPCAAAPDVRDACPNCGEGFGGRRPAFCPACGQETRVEPPTLREFAQHFGGAYISTEGALWRTLRLLLTRPGELTVQYLAGRRKHYVLPLRLYLTISLLALLVLRFTGQAAFVRGLDRPEVAAAERGALPTVLLQLRSVRLGLQEGVFVCEHLPAPACELLRERAATDTRTFLRKLRQANERLLSHLGVVMFVLLPLFALCLRLVHRRAGMRYTAHLVYALHLHAFWFLALAMMQLARPPLAWAGLAMMAGYALMAGRRVYGGRWWQRASSAMLLAAMYVALLALTLPLAWLLALVV